MLDRGNLVENKPQNIGTEFFQILHFECASDASSIEPYSFDQVDHARWLRLDVGHVERDTPDMIEFSSSEKR